MRKAAVQRIGVCTTLLVLSTKNGARFALGQSLQSSDCHSQPFLGNGQRTCTATM